jgi:putative nucleotidyltransferase with HDIG domain
MKKCYEQGVPTVEDAKLLLEEAKNLFPGPWVQHSLWVAEAAKLIAENCEGLNSDAAYVLGMLHDIGRRDSIKKGVSSKGHMISGYEYAKELGYDLVAKICMTHSCPTKSTYDIEDVVNKKCTDEELKFFQNYFNEVEYNDYDKLIQLCDSLALPNGFTLLEKRVFDVAIRHGVNEFSVSKWKAFMELKNYFNKKIGKSVYTLLPGVIENTFEFET